MLSIKIIEGIDNAQATKTKTDFLPPAVVAARQSSRSVFAIIINIALLLISAALCVCGLSLGAPVFLLGITLLAVEVVGFVKSKGSAGGYGLALRRNVYLIAAILLFGFAVFSEFYKPYYWYCDMFEPLYRFAKKLPKPFSDIIDVGFMGEFIICTALGTTLLAIGLSYCSLNRSKYKNLPYSKTLFFSFIISVLASAVLICDGLERMNILPSNYIYEDWGQSVKYYDVGICFGFSAIALMSAIRLLVIFIRMRKVKNAVFKA